MFTYKKIIVGSVVKARIGESTVVGKVECMMQDKEHSLAAIRDKNGRLLHVSLSNCKLFRICIAQKMYDVHGILDEKGVT